jgi:glycosyltransferase involved in cell wall biosynthesis
VKVAIVIDGLARGGAELQALNAVFALSREGCDARLYYYRGRSAYTPVESHPAIEQGRVTRIPGDGGPPVLLWRLARTFRRERIDVVHGFKSVTTLYSSLAGRLAGTPVVLGGCRVEYDRRGLLWLGHRLIRNLPDGWIVNSRAVARSLQTRLGVPTECCHVVENGVDRNRWASILSGAQARERLGLPAGAPTMVCVAMLRPQKNHALLFQAAARVFERFPSAFLLLAGDGPARNDLEQAAARMNISSRVRFLGNRSDVADILAAGTVSVLASHYEGTSNALIESMCAGVPVVTTDYPGAEELVTDGKDGFVVPRGDAGALADRMGRLLGDMSLRAA